MKKFGIFYGSSTGVTAETADEIAKTLGTAPADVYNVRHTKYRNMTTLYLVRQPGVPVTCKTIGMTFSTGWKYST